MCGNLEYDFFARHRGRGMDRAKVRTHDDNAPRRHRRGRNGHTQFADSDRRRVHSSVRCAVFISVSYAFL